MKEHSSKFSKIILSLLVAFALSFAIVPSGAFAATPEPIPMDDGPQRVKYIDVINTQTRFTPSGPGYTVVTATTYKQLSFSTSYEVSSLTLTSSWTGTYNGQSGTFNQYRYNYRIW